MDAGALFKRAASCDYPPSNTGSLVVRRLEDTRRVVRAHVPLLTKALLGATFVEDAIRTLCQADAQLYFYQSELGVPAVVAGLLIGVATVAGLGGAAALLAPAAEDGAVGVLLGLVLYQQLAYGRHAPVTSGNAGFLLRNACLAAALALIPATKRLAAGRSLLPGLPAPTAGTAAAWAARISLGSRVLLAALGLEAFVTLGPRAGLLTLPLVAAVALGFRTRPAAVALMAVFAVSSVAATPFWSVVGDSAYAAYTRDVMRFECVQTLSIMSGLFTLIRAHVNPLSVDAQLCRRKSF